MKITKEVRGFVEYNFGTYHNVEDAATYVHNELCEHWPDMLKIRESKLFKDLLAAFEWVDERHGIYPSDGYAQKFLREFENGGWR